MKKIMFLMLMLVVPFSVRASEYYEEVDFQVSFMSDVDDRVIKSVVVTFIDASNVRHDEVVYANRSFKNPLNNIPLGKIFVDQAMVSYDYSGKYNVDYSVQYFGTKALIKMVVSRNNKTSGSVNIPQDAIDKVEGKTTTTDKNAPIYTTAPLTSSNITTSKITTTTKNIIDEKEQELNRKTRQSIYKIIYAVAGLILLVVLVVVAVKIANANK